MPATRSTMNLFGKRSNVHTLHEARGIAVGVLLGAIAWAAIIAAGLAAMRWF